MSIKQYLILLFFCCFLMPPGVDVYPFCTRCKVFPQGDSSSSSFSAPFPLSLTLILLYEPCAAPSSLPTSPCPKGGLPSLPPWPAGLRSALSVSSRFSWPSSHPSMDLPSLLATEAGSCPLLLPTPTPPPTAWPRLTLIFMKSKFLY